MFKASEIVSKPLISLFEAKICGTISNIIFDSKFRNAKLLVVDCDNDDDIATKYLELSEVVNLEFDAVIIKNYEYLLSEWTTPAKGIHSPINCACYNQDGKLIGTVKDITIEGTKIVSVLVAGTEYPPSKLLSISDKLILINDTDLPIKLPVARKFPSKSLFGATKEKRVQITETNDTSSGALPPEQIEPSSGAMAQTLPSQELAPLNSGSVSVLSVRQSASNLASSDISPSPTLSPSSPKQALITSSTLQQAKLLLEKLKYSQLEPQTAPKASLVPTDSDIEMPTKINQSSTIVSRTPSTNINSTKSYQFLCGKTSTADISDASGATIIKSGELIDNGIIGIAKLNDKLVHLALHSK